MAAFNSFKTRSEGQATKLRALGRLRIGAPQTESVAHHRRLPVRRRLRHLHIDHHTTGLLSQPPALTSGILGTLVGRQEGPTGKFSDGTYFQYDRALETTVEVTPAGERFPVKLVAGNFQRESEPVVARKAAR
jgi:hypothetical protein